MHFTTPRIPIRKCCRVRKILVYSVLSFRSYLHQATLVRHQRYECGISASYPCQLCGRKFKRRDVLKGHMEKCMNKSVASPINPSSASPMGSTSHLTMSIPSIPTISAISSLAMTTLPYGGPWTLELVRPSCKNSQQGTRASWYFYTLLTNRTCLKLSICKQSIRRFLARIRALQAEPWCKM